MDNLKKIILETLNELVDPSSIDLSSFKQQQTLNPLLWVDGDKLKPQINKKLYKIATDYYESLDIPWVKISDIIITGSLANYNWSNYSDIDLHILLDFYDVNENEVLVKDYMDSKRKIWNDTHNIKIYNFDVELYVQDINEEHTSSGVYSILNDEWVIKPKRENIQLDKKLIKRKASEIMNKIDSVIELYNNGEYDAVLDCYDKLWDKIKKMRKTGLDREGEYSYENIVFKVLRRNGYMEKFIDITNKSYDKLNSI